MISLLESLLRGAVQVFSRQELETKVSQNRPLRVKYGVDPTAPDLHLGHTVSLNRLRSFQDAGHTAVLIIGDYTARIGDPSGRSETRPPLTVEAVAANAETYLAQVFKVLDKTRTEVRWNSEWLMPLFANTDADPSRRILSLMGKHTLQQLTERDDFQKRLASNTPISLLELLYPLMQGYDSVAVKADVEMGGTDQLFNLLMGREIQKDFGQTSQVVLTLPLLEGTDGVRKMSKSYGNAITLSDAPGDMFGKVLSLSDDMMWKYFELLTDQDVPALQAGHPMEAKKKLGEVLVDRFHGPSAGAAARAEFEKVFSKREVPQDIVEHVLSRSPQRLSEILVESKVAPSKNEARRLIQQGAVELAGERVPDDRDITVHGPLLLKVGKRQFRRLVSPAS
ncbi:MAG: tyrosine--tRNA ligase [Elusimicrobia bacterium]|jgi:tyrosyl-tRNA synthetase|nr:tyrosine--tRNA ligase [Elusimicrobiota bacterium]